MVCSKRGKQHKMSININNFCRIKLTIFYFLRKICEIEVKQDVPDCLASENNGSNLSALSVSNGEAGRDVLLYYLFE